MGSDLHSMSPESLVPVREQLPGATEVKGRQEVGERMGTTR